ncbi:MAG: hypothetical protein J6W51_09880 [Fibrobacter sp.]|nr:hypothetical protein [Fibrobacter sp.]
MNTEKKIALVIDCDNAKVDAIYGIMKNSPSLERRAYVRHMVTGKQEFQGTTAFPYQEEITFFISQNQQAMPAELYVSRNLP